MRVLHILKATGIAGAEQHLLALLAGQRARGWDARFLVLTNPDNPVDDFYQAANERGIPMEREVIHSHWDIGVIGRIRRRIRAFAPQVAHTHMQHGDLYGLPAALWADVPVRVLSRHEDDVRRRRWPLRLLNWALWRSAHGGIAISEAVRQFILNVEGARPDQVQTVYYGVKQAAPLDTSRARHALRAELGLSDEAQLLGMVCRLVGFKGIPYTIQALVHLPSVHLVIAGDGPLRGELSACAKQYGVVDHVHFLGWRTDIAAVMAGLDMLVVSSVGQEGFGLVMLEAMQQAVPCIGSRVSSIPEVIDDGVTGYLFPERDPEAIAACAARLLQDEDLRLRLGTAGQERARTRFGAERMVDETLAFYQRWLPQT